MAKLPRLPMRKEHDPLAPERGQIFSPRFLVALLLIFGGIAWILYYYYGIQPNNGWPEAKGNPAGGPTFFQDLEHKNYLIGFTAFFIGLMISAHPSTPLGRGRGVVVGMLGCFLVGLVWICTFYVFSDDLSQLWIFNDLGQWNLVVGIAFMAVGFSFATKWE